MVSVVICLALLIFALGCLIGYAHQRANPSPACAPEPPVVIYAYEPFNACRQYDVFNQLHAMSSSSTLSEDKLTPVIHRVCTQVKDVAVPTMSDMSDLDEDSDEDFDEDECCLCTGACLCAGKFDFDFEPEEGNEDPFACSDASSSMAVDSDQRSVDSFDDFLPREQDEVKLVHLPFDQEEEREKGEEEGWATEERREDGNEEDAHAHVEEEEEAREKEEEEEEGNEDRGEKGTEKDANEERGEVEEEKEEERGNEEGGNADDKVVQLPLDTPDFAVSYDGVKVPDLRQLLVKHQLVKNMHAANKLKRSDIVAMLARANIRA